MPVAAAGGGITGVVATVTLFPNHMPTAVANGQRFQCWHIRTLYARKDLRRAPFGIWLKSAFSCFNYVQSVYQRR